jgi:hypothetical protein
MTVGAIANYLQQRKQQQKKKENDERPPKERVLVIERAKSTTRKQKDIDDCLAKADRAYRDAIQAADKRFDDTIHERFPEASDPQTGLGWIPIMLGIAGWFAEAEKEGAYERAASERDRARKAC